MKKHARFLLSLILLPVVLSGCIVVPWDDGGYRGHGGRHRGWYDDRR